jgi:hydroxypyruvate reductase
VTLLLSDVPSDQPMDIASGPTVRTRRPVPTRWTSSGDMACGAIGGSGYSRKRPRESVKPGDPRLRGSETRFVATPQMALEAAAAVGRSAGGRYTSWATASKARRATSARCSRD